MCEIIFRFVSFFVFIYAIKYDVVYNFYQKQKELNKVEEQKSVEHDKFDLKYLDSPDKFFVGNKYPYPSNIQFLQA